MKFKAGDAVWARFTGNFIGPGLQQMFDPSKAESSERAAVVAGVDLFGSRVTSCGEVYYVDLADEKELRRICACCLRPRRDDYQQAEKLGDLEVIRKLKSTSITPQPVEV